MFGSVFKKQFFLYMSILAISFILMSVALTQAFRAYFTNQKEAALKAQGEKISQLYARAFRPGAFVDMAAVNQLGSQLQIIYEYLESSFIIVDTEYTVFAVSEDIDRSHMGEIVEIPELTPVMDGVVVTSQGRIDALYDEPVLSVAYPIYMGDMVTAAVIMNSSLPELERTITDAYRMIVLCLLLSVIISFVLIYISTKKMVSPLREMNQAAKIIADGDFERRITVKSSDEIGQLAASFNEMAESLNRQELVRRDFIANISHDFRSPLTSITGFLTAISDGTTTPDKINYYIGIVLEETERLKAMANNILDLNDAHNVGVALNMSDFGLNELIKSTVVNFETRILQKQLNIVLLLMDNLTVTADYDKIRRVVYNLFDNAVKFTPEHGSITVETSVKDGKACVSIKDTGCGISAEDKKRVFERFYKADASRGADRRGSGLGLSIVQSFTDAQGGRFAVSIDGDLFKASVYLPPAM